MVSYVYRQEVEANRIWNTATDARNTSRTAQDLAREAMRKLGLTADEILNLRRRYEITNRE